MAYASATATGGDLDDHDEEDDIHMTVMAAEDDDDDDDGDSDENENDDDDDDDDDYAIDDRDEDVDIGFRNHGQRKRQTKNGLGTRNRNKEEAIYGVFLDDDDDDRQRGDSRRGGRVGTGSRTSSSSGFVAPMFVAAKRPDTRKEVVSQAGETQSKPAPPVASATLGDKETTRRTEDTDNETAPLHPAPSEEQSKKVNVDGDNEDDQDEEAVRLRQEQKEADDYFLRLLEKARQKTTKSTMTMSSSAKRRSAWPAVPSQPLANVDAVGAGGFTNGGLPPSHIGLGLGVPSSFGGGRGSYEKASTESSTPPAVPVDPTLGRWEKHTKGIGSKLLSKMGWSGRGGLGSTRRQRGVPTPEETKTTTRSDGDSGPPSNEPPNQASTTERDRPLADATTTATTTTGTVKRGISRPVEVVVRPNNLGLGFGNFKEATQLKVNRQIEAEVRGIDPTEVIKKHNRRKRRRHADLDGDDSGDDEDDNDNDDDVVQSGMGGRPMTSSAIPSTHQLLSQQSWKRRRRLHNDKNGQRDRPEIITYQELIERQKQKMGDGNSTGQPIIIDMRGPDFASNIAASRGTDPSTTKTDQVKLGEELLYNLSFLLNTYENKLHSTSAFVTSTQRKAESIKSDIRDLEERHEKGQERIRKIEKALNAVESVKNITANIRIRPGRSIEESMEMSRKQVETVVSDLERTFTEEERETLQFWSVLAPTLLSPVYQATMEGWDPLHKEGFNTSSKTIIDAFFDYNRSDVTNGGNGIAEVNHKTLRERRTLMESMILNILVPKIKRALDSSRWDPIKDGDVALDICEYVHGNAVGFEKSFHHRPGHVEDDANDLNQVLPSERDSPTELSPGQSLANAIKTDLIIDTVYPKLQTAILQWKPIVLSNRTKPFKLQDRLDLWVLPWIPHLDHPVLLPSLLADCKRKLKGALSFLQRTILVDQDFVAASIELVRPWIRVYDGKTFHRMMADDTSVVLRLARLLAKQSIATDATEQDWEGLHLLMKMHGYNLISDRDFLSLVEAEVLYNWAYRVHTNLSLRGQADVASKEEAHQGIEMAAMNYRKWKLHVLVDPSLMGKPLPNWRRSVLLLQKDVFICRIFYSVLRMIYLASNSMMDDLDALLPEKTSYHIVAARRVKENQSEVEEAFTRMESRSVAEATARIRLQRRNVPEPTFRDVIEELANERGILFQPRMGSKALKDGKQVFLFDKFSIYLEGDVVFCWKETTWIPMSVDELMRMASAA